MARRLGVDGRRRRRSRPASAPRSSWPGCRTGCACAARRDTVLYPAVSYPTYAMGATLAGCRAVPVRATLAASTARSTPTPRALCLWVNTPGNPAGGLDDLGAAAAWGRAHGVPVLTDECYVEFTWDGPPRTILEHGTDGVLAVHSLSKRSNLAGVAGRLLRRRRRPRAATSSEVRKHAGFMVPGPVQAAAVAALGRRRPRRRAARALPRAGCEAMRGGAGRARRRRADAGRRLLPLGPGARRRRLGPHRAGWPRGRRARCRPASSTARPAPATCASRWCSPTTASTWSPNVSVLVQRLVELDGAHLALQHLDGARRAVAPEQETAPPAQVPSLHD